MNFGKWIYMEYNTKKLIKKMLYLISLILQLHSKAPTTEIKKNWEIFALGVTFILFMNFFSGAGILGIQIIFPFSEIINYYGGFIFIMFIIVFGILFIDLKKLIKKL
jgi:hypothetical protein